MESITLTVEELKAGMQIAEDIYIDGDLFLSAFTALTSKSINHLQDRHPEPIAVIQNEFSLNPEDIIKNYRALSAHSSFNIAGDIKEKVKEASVIISRIGVSIEDAIRSAESASEMLYNAIMQSPDECYFNMDDIRSRDDYTFTHCVDVAILSGLIVKNAIEEGIAGWCESDIKKVAIAGLLHDIGKKHIPLEILNKPGRLDEEEKHIMDQHPVFSYTEIRNTDLDPAIKLGILQHHERYMGGGYPQGVSHEKIHPYAQIITIADVFDALTSDRPYKTALPPHKAYEIMLEMQAHFNPLYFNLFFKDLILYKTDSLVRCSDGTFRRVIAQNRNYPLRPVLQDLNGTVVNLLNDEFSQLKIC